MIIYYTYTREDRLAQLNELNENLKKQLQLLKNAEDTSKVIRIRTAAAQRLNKKYEFNQNYLSDLKNLMAHINASICTINEWLSNPKDTFLRDEVEQVIPWRFYLYPFEPSDRQPVESVSSDAPSWYREYSDAYQSINSLAQLLYTRASYQQSVTD